MADNMRTVDDILAEIVTVEGDYVDHAHDRGGATRYGITEETARAAGYTGDMRELPRELAHEIYLERYVTAPGFDLLHELCPKIGAEVIDTGVLMGQGTAGHILQRALALLQRHDATPLRIDGRVGPATRKALHSYLLWRGDLGITVLLRLLNSLQATAMVDLAERDERQRTFLFGWVAKRVVMP